MVIPYTKNDIRFYRAYEGLMPIQVFSKSINVSLSVLLGLETEDIKQPTGNLNDALDYTIAKGDVIPDDFVKIDIS